MKAYLGIFVVLFLAPVLVALAEHRLGGAESNSWWSARRDSAELAPDPRHVREAVVQVYAARAWGWRGALGVHTWIAVKPTEGDSYTRYEVIGWAVRRGSPAVRALEGIPDAHWFGSPPQVLLDLRGADAERVLQEIGQVASAYPYPDSYRIWPGPNSNTFVAHVAREVGGMRVDLPPTAVGKDFLPGGRILAYAPSGTGLQLSLLGMFGVLVAAEEGVEVNLLGLTVGIDLSPLAIKLPGIGRFGFG